jgi:uncharacterized protein with PIN domain
MNAMVPQENAPDKAGAPDSAATPRLLVDAMLGRLTRWLRLMGYDAAYWRTGSDSALAARARAEGRLIITRDRQLAGRRHVSALLIRAETLDEQIAEIRAILGADPAPFTRCSECNAELAELPHAEAETLVPPFVWHTQTEFRRCPSCGRVYWKGTHWPGMAARISAEEQDGLNHEAQ